MNTHHMSSGREKTRSQVGTPQAPREPKMEKGHNFPLFIGFRVCRVCGRFLHWAGKNRVAKLGNPKPLGNPKWKKDHNFPLFIGSRVGGFSARILHWAGKKGSQLDDLGAFFFGFSISGNRIFNFSAISFVSSIDRVV